MARVTLCVEILKMFERHFASFKWHKLLVIVELEKQSMTFSVGCLPVAPHLKIRFGLLLIVRTILQSPPIGLRKIFIDYFFFQADQWDCTKSLSTFEGWDGLLTSEILQDSGKSGEAT